jgi:hypothetical protein
MQVDNKIETITRNKRIRIDLYLALKTPTHKLLTKYQTHIKSDDINQHDDYK